MLSVIENESEDGIEHIDLLPQQRIDNENDATKTDWKDSILLRTTMFGANGLFLGAHRLVNGKYLVMLGSSGSAAASLISTSQTVVLGSALGFLLGTGIDFGMAVGKKEYKMAGDIAKTGTILSSTLGAISTVILLGATGVYPLIYSEETAKITSEFFYGYLPGAIPQLFLTIGSQVAFQVGDWYVPPLSMFLVLTISGGTSYLLAFNAGLGAFGIGLGGSIGSVLSATILGSWFLRDKYKPYELYTLHINEFSKKMKSLVNSGWKLAAQRLTEWSNLLIITTIVGIENNDNLMALSPALLYLGLFSPLQQGFAQALGMIISKNKGEIQRAILLDNSSSIKRLHQNNIHAIIKSNSFGLLLGSGLAVSFYLARQPLTQPFLPNNSSQAVQELSESLLLASMIGLIPDLVRIISAGAFRAWNDLLFPTIISAVFMSVVGIPVGYGLGKVFEQSEVMLYVRDVMVLLSAVVILKRMYDHIRHDAKALNLNGPDREADLQANANAIELSGNDSGPLIFSRSESTRSTGISQLPNREADLQATANVTELSSNDSGPLIFSRSESTRSRSWASKLQSFRLKYGI